jgi:hypothetical protein
MGPGTADGEKVAVGEATRCNDEMFKKAEI